MQIDSIALLGGGADGVAIFLADGGGVLEIIAIFANGVGGGAGATEINLMVMKY